jgi:hypothetical protein
VLNAQFAHSKTHAKVVSQKRFLGRSVEQCVPKSYQGESDQSQPKMSHAGERAQFLMFRKFERVLKNIISDNVQIL